MQIQKSKRNLVKDNTGKTKNQPSNRKKKTLKNQYVLGVERL